MGWTSFLLSNSVKAMKETQITHHNLALS